MTPVSNGGTNTPSAPDAIPTPVGMGNKAEPNGGKMLLPFEVALDDELGKLIVALHELNDAELDRVLDAAQMVDSEAQDLLEARYQERRGL